MEIFPSFVFLCAKEGASFQKRFLQEMFTSSNKKTTDRDNIYIPIYVYCFEAYLVSS